MTTTAVDLVLTQEVKQGDREAYFGVETGLGSECPPSLLGGKGRQPRHWLFFAAEGTFLLCHLAGPQRLVCEEGVVIPTCHGSQEDQ